MGGPMFASDLDRTLIYSAAAMRLGHPVDDPTCVEIYAGAPTSFIDPAALEALAALSQERAFVPVTTRTREQYARIALPGVRRAHAVTTNGAVILDADGVACGDWAADVRRRGESGAPYAEARRIAGEVWQRPWVRKVRDAEEQFFYAVIDPDTTPPEWYAELTALVAGIGWVLSIQGRKCYVIPPGLTKEAAVAEVASRLGSAAFAAAGDSWLDAGLLAAADLAVRPAHGELDEQAWTCPDLLITPSSGGRAAAEIVSAVDRWSRGLAPAWTTVSSDIGP